MCLVDIKTNMTHPLTRKTTQSEWTCYNPNCDIHTIVCDESLDSLIDACVQHFLTNIKV